MATIILVEHIWDKQLLADHKSGDLGPIVTTGTWPERGNGLLPLGSSLGR
jgi:hypothetical protein